MWHYYNYVRIYIHTFFTEVLSGNNPNVIAAIVGGLVGILLISLLGFDIAVVILSLRKRGEYHSTVIVS